MNNIDLYQAKILNEIYIELFKISPLFDDPYQESASKNAIEQLRFFVGEELPVDFVSFYSLCNGCKNSGPQAFAYELEFLSIENCLASLKVNLDVINMLDSEQLKLDYADVQINPDIEYSKSRVPFASATRQQICIDLAPSPKGVVGQVIFIDSEYKVGIYLAKNVTEFLEQFKEDLVDSHYGASDTRDDFLSCDREITLVNWQWSDRWVHVPFDRSLLGKWNYS